MTLLLSLTTIGLALDAAGALTLVLPEFSRFEPLTTPREKINRLDQGRDSLLSIGSLTLDDEGFKEVCEALEEHVETHGPVKEIAVVDLEDEPDAVEVRYDTDGDATYARDGRTSRALVDRHIERHIHKLERRVQERIFRIGSGFLLVGFTLQLLASL